MKFIFINNVPVPIGNFKKIAIFRALQLGDMLCAIPAVRALRAAYPDAEITLLGLPWAESFTQRFHKYFDRFIHFPGYIGLPEQPFDERKFYAFLEEIRAEKFDLILQMQGNGTIVNQLLHQFGATHVAGFHNKDSYVDSPLFLEYPEDGHEIDRHLSLMKHLGIAPRGRYLEFPLTAKDYLSFASLNLSVEPHKYICVHPGSRGTWRQWPPRYFAMLADYCSDMGFDLVVTGTESEKNITRQLISHLRHPAIDLTGLTDLGSLAVLIKNAFMLISNCTGVSHIASALQTPGIIISMDGEPHRWGPLNHTLHKTIDWTSSPSVIKVLSRTHALLQRRMQRSA